MQEFIYTARVSSDNVRMSETDTGARGCASETSEPRRRRPYVKPTVVDRGRLVEVALGGSPGTGDSGGGALIENPLV